MTVKHLKILRELQSTVAESCHCTPTRMAEIPSLATWQMLARARSYGNAHSLLPGCRTVDHSRRRLVVSFRTEQPSKYSAATKYPNSLKTYLLPQTLDLQVCSSFTPPDCQKLKAPKMIFNRWMDSKLGYIIFWILFNYKEIVQQEKALACQAWPPEIYHEDQHGRRESTPTDCPLADMYTQ